MKDHYANALSVIKQIEKINGVKAALKLCLRLSERLSYMPQYCMNVVYNSDYFWS